MRLKKGFFSRDAEIVAKQLLGKILIRKLGSNFLAARIVETEAYLGKKDPASRASKGKNKVSIMMKDEPGKILVYNVHKYKMLNLVTNKRGEYGAVLIRALEPLNFKKRCSGPGLLTIALKIDDHLHGKSVAQKRELFIFEEGNKEKVEIIESFRFGVKKDLPKKLRFYIKGNKYVSRK